METESGACEKTQPASPIESAFGGLRTELDELEKRLGKLIERIEPVLGPSMPGNDQGCAKEEGGVGDITARVRNITGEIQSHINRVNNVISRLEV